MFERILSRIEELTKIVEDLKKQNNRIAELQTALDEANAQIVVKDAVIAEKDAEIVRLQEALDKANADLEKINTEELQKLDEAIARLEAIINA